MECMEARRALKSSFSSELALKSTNPQGILDDFWCVTGLPGDDFSIDEFFDLPNEDNNTAMNKVDGGFGEDDDEEEDKESNSSGSLSSQDPVDESNSVHFSTHHLGIPDDDMQELELWSHFMDDSVPEPTLACPKSIMDVHSKKTGFTFMNRVEAGSKPASTARVPYFPTAVPVRPRSKRSRTCVNRVWLTGSPPKTESSSSSSTSPSSPVSTLLFAPPVHHMGMYYYNFGKPPTKKPKKKPAVAINGETGLNPPVQRRCTHCQVTKTPQWRAGPNGPKTLCNACGVRFKSGRLFPEYRPACSPTFSIEAHSNSHRKVLEMRRKKETTEPMTGSTPAFSSS